MQDKAELWVCGRRSSYGCAGQLGVEMVWAATKVTERWTEHPKLTLPADLPPTLATHLALPVHQLPPW